MLASALRHPREPARARGSARGRREQPAPIAGFLGGDFASWSPWPQETIERLRTLPNTTWIRGNGERWLREPPLRPAGRRATSSQNYDSGLGTDEGWLYSLQAQVELDGVLYVHGSPLSRRRELSAGARSDDDERLLNGVRNRTVVFGHSHLQFQRPGPNGTYLINPGSAGMPLDGDVARGVRAAA